MNWQGRLGVVGERSKGKGHACSTSFGTTRGKPGLTGDEPGTVGWIAWVG